MRSKTLTWRAQVDMEEGFAVILRTWLVLILTSAGESISLVPAVSIHGVLTAMVVAVYYLTIFL